MELSEYIERRLRKNNVTPEEFWTGYEEFKVGVFLKSVRESAGLTQEELAQKTNTTKSAISRMENHAEDIKLSTLDRVARALGKKISIGIY